MFQNDATQSYYSLSFDELKQKYCDNDPKISAKSAQVIILDAIEAELLAESTNLVTSLDSAKFFRFFEKIGHLLTAFPRNKLARLLRKIVTNLKAIADTQLLSEIYEKLVKWCDSTNLQYFKLGLLERLAQIEFIKGDRKRALELIDDLTQIANQKDDKQLILSVNCLSLEISLSDNDVESSKIKLAAARSIANSIYVSPELQSRLSYLSGLTFALCEQFSTAISYLAESHQVSDAVLTVDETLSIVLALIVVEVFNGSDMEHVQKLALIDGLATENSRVFESLFATLQCYINKNIRDYIRLLDEFEAEFGNYRLVHGMLSNARHKLAIDAVKACVIPYDVIRLGYLADKVGLKVQEAQQYIASLIIDGALKGVICEYSGVFRQWHEEAHTKVYAKSVKICSHLIRQADKWQESLSANT